MRILRNFLVLLSSFPVYKLFLFYFHQKRPHFLIPDMLMSIMATIFCIVISILLSVGAVFSYDVIEYINTNRAFSFRISKSPQVIRHFLLINWFVFVKFAGVYNNSIMIYDIQMNLFN